MPTHAERRALPYTPEQLFDIVADIERYPEFLPWCVATRVSAREGNVITADVVIGTPYFMSPEQALGNKELVDQRTDVFAMGVILYAMLSGELPFEGDAIPNILYNIVHGERPSLQARCPGLPAAMEQAVHKALARDPERRQASMEELKHDFSRALHEGLGRQTERK